MVSAAYARYLRRPSVADRNPRPGRLRSHRAGRRRCVVDPAIDSPMSATATLSRFADESRRHRRHARRRAGRLSRTRHGGRRPRSHATSQRQRDRDPRRPRRDPGCPRRLHRRGDVDGSRRQCEQRLARFGDDQVNQERMNEASSAAVFMHCPPTAGSRSPARSSTAVRKRRWQADIGLLSSRELGGTQHRYSRRSLRGVRRKAHSEGDRGRP